MAKYRTNQFTITIVAIITVVIIIYFFISDLPHPLTSEEMTMEAPELREHLSEARLKHTRVMKRIAAVVEVINVITLIAWKIYDRRTRKLREDHYFNIGENVRELVNVKDRQNEHLSRLLHELLTKEYKAIDEKCRDYYANSSSQSRRKVSDEVIAMVDRFSSDETIRELEQTVDKYQSGLIAEFRTDLPSLKPADYRLFLFSTLGFSTSAISVFLKEEKLDAVYNRKSRLKAKIKKLDSETARTKYLSYL